MGMLPSAAGEAGRNGSGFSAGLVLDRLVTSRPLLPLSGFFSVSFELLLPPGVLALAGTHP